MTTIPRSACPVLVSAVLSRIITPRFSRLLLPIVVISCFCFHAGMAFAQEHDHVVPRLVHFRGNIGEAAVTTTTFVPEITFSLYSTAEGGAPLWQERQAVQLLEKGEFDVLLGASSASGLPNDLFVSGEERWLGVQVGDRPELPRTRIASVPYSLVAETLAGHPVTDFVLQTATVPPASSISERPGPAQTTLSPSEAAIQGTPNYLAKFLDAATLATSNVVETAIGVGVDVQNPTQRVDVYGRIKLRARDSATSGLWLTDTDGAEQLFMGQIGLASSSPFGIWHGGAWRLALTSAGDLGLGVGIYPAARFDLAGRAMIRASDQGSSGIWFTGHGGIRSLFVGQRGISSDDSFGIWHNGAWRFSLDFNGNVGIGGDAQSKLDVFGRMRLRAAGTQPSGMWLSGETDLPQLFVGQTDVTANAPFGILHGGNWRFILTNGGNVGIGTTAPSESLEVAGNLKLSNGGKLLFPDGTMLGSATPSIVAVKARDNSIQVSTAAAEALVSVASSGINSTKLADGSVTAPKIADYSVTNSKLSDASVSTSKLVDKSVTLAKLADAQVTAQKLADGSVINSKIVDGSVTTSKLADGSITGAKIVAGSILPSAISGTAATTSANTFSGSQTINGSVIIRDTLQVSSYTEMGRLVTTNSSPLDYTFVARNTGLTNNAVAVRAETSSVNGSAISTVANATTGNSVGVHALTYSPQGAGVYGEGASTAGVNFGLRGLSRGTSGVGVKGEAISSHGSTYGLWGVAAGDSYAAGVYADATSISTYYPTYGVYGRSASNTGIGVFAYATNLSGTTFGVIGRVDSPNGVGGSFSNFASSGSVITGNNSTRRIFRVDVTGNVYANGTFNPNGADFAESVSVRREHSYLPGDVMVIDEDADRQFTISQEPYATNVAGIFSTQPGVLGSKHPSETRADDIPLAMVGIVPCRVSAENGPIRRGDLLVASSTPGHAMRGTDRLRMNGAIIGKALQPLQEGTGIIEVLVSLQ